MISSKLMHEVVPLTGYLYDPCVEVDDVQDAHAEHEHDGHAQSRVHPSRPAVDADLDEDGRIALGAASSKAIPFHIANRIRMGRHRLETSHTSYEVIVKPG